jgi:hypothetical protein
MSDVVCIYIQLVLSRYDRDAQGAFAHLLIVFMLCRTREKQKTWLANGVRLWGRHPIHIICQEYRARHTSSRWRRIRTIHRLALNQGAPFFKTQLEQQQERLEPCKWITLAPGEATTYMLSASNVIAWIEIVEAYNTALLDLPTTDTGNIDY